MIMTPLLSDNDLIGALGPQQSVQSPMTPLTHNREDSSLIKQLFFTWFNSVSPDNSSLNLSQFSLILNRIFSSSLNRPSQDKISEIFKLLKSDNNTETIHFNQFLSKNTHTFSNIMISFMDKDPNIKCILEAVPNTSQNPKHNTLQQMLYDQTKEILHLKVWINEIGLPFTQRSSEENRMLLRQLSDSLSNKNKMNQRLKLLNEESHQLARENLDLSNKYSGVEEDLSFLERSNTFLKRVNEGTQHQIDTLCMDLDRTLSDLESEKQKNKAQSLEMDGLDRVNAQLKKQMNLVKNKCEKQSKEIKRLQSINSQIELALEVTTMALEEKTQEIEHLNANAPRWSDVPSDNIGDYGNDFRRNIKLSVQPNEALNTAVPKCTKMKSIPKPQSVLHSRRSYGFVYHDSTHNLDNELDTPTDTSPLLTSRSMRSLPEDSDIFELDNADGVSEFMRRKRSHSIVSVGGGQRMDIFKSEKDLRVEEMKGECKKLYTDSDRGVDVYVFTNTYDPQSINYFENDSSENESGLSLNQHSMLVHGQDRRLSIDSIDDYCEESNDYFIEYNELENDVGNDSGKLKEMRRKQNNEMEKLKVELEDLSVKYGEESSDMYMALLNGEKGKKNTKQNGKSGDKGCYLFGFSLW